MNIHTESSGQEDVECPVQLLDPLEVQLHGALHFAKDTTEEDLDPGSTEHHVQGQDLMEVQLHRRLYAWRNTTVESLNSDDTEDNAQEGKAEQSSSGIKPYNVLQVH